MGPHDGHGISIIHAELTSGEGRELLKVKVAVGKDLDGMGCGRGVTVLAAIFEGYHWLDEMKKLR